MALNDRKFNILQAIINDYIATAEPVGSRTIAKKYDLGISSATIRNEMSDLEEMGFIIQPHASSGRIPSDLGYRLYVDSIMDDCKTDEECVINLQNIVNSNLGRIDFLMEETAKMLSMLTNYTAIISEPKTTNLNLKQIRLLPLDENNIILIVATEENLVKNYTIKLKLAPADNVIFEISNVINEILKGVSLENLDSLVVNKLHEEVKKIILEYEEILDKILECLYNILKEFSNIQLHLSGENNILTFPEFSDVLKAKSIFQTLEKKDVLINLLENHKEEAVEILIGDEIAISEMKDCSIITAKYRISENFNGAIAVLGPRRMNYPQVVSLLSNVVKDIEDALGYNK